MTAVLPHAPPEKTVKAKAAEVPLAKGATHQAQTPLPVHGKFQALLEKAAPKAAAVPPEKAKVPVKASEPPAERTKEAKKHDSKEPKNDVNPLSLVAVVTPAPKPELLAKAAKTGDGEALAAQEKAKAQKTDHKLAHPVQASAASVMNPVAGRPGEGAPIRGDRTEEKQKVFVVDRRTEAKEKEKDKLKLPGADAAAQQPVTSAGDPKAGPRPEVKADAPPVVFQTVADRSTAAPDPKAQNTPISPRDALTFQQYMAERGYGQMVDQARIVLKDQNAGEIRMTLHPESLGKVRVALNLSDSSLAGQIFVENQTVKEIFQSNMDNLLQAFRDGGWNNLSLQVSVGGEGRSGQNGQPFAHAPQAQDYGRQVAQTVTEGQGQRIVYGTDRQINLTA